GVLILLDYFLVPGLVYVVAALAMNSLIPDIPYWLWILIFLIPMTTLSMLGIKPTARANKVLLAIELFALAAFIAYTLGYAISNNLSFSLTPFYNQSTFNINTILTATSVAVLSYLGFDAATTLAEEHRGKATYVGRAVVLSVFLIGIFFITQTYLAYITYPTYQFQDPSTGFYEVAQAVGGIILLTITTLATAISWGIGDGLVATTAIARVIYAMGRDGFLPKLVARVHPKYGTPWIATLLSGLISTIIAVSISLDVLTSLVNFGALSAFILMHVAAIYYFGYKNKKYLVTVPSIFGLLVLGFIWYGLDINAKILGFSWLVFWLIYTAILTRGFRKKVSLPSA
ncbi:MAG TPA: amino acid permease, partial [Geobacterales bacterium]|nr:amino acid permease [Geobacterales bacterium]